MNQAKRDRETDRHRGEEKKRGRTKKDREGSERQREQREKENEGHRDGGERHKREEERAIVHRLCRQISHKTNRFVRSVPLQMVRIL